MPGTIELTAFAKDTLKGLLAEEKYLLPKYFYDERGSQIFCDIMRMPEYYPTSCEYEIFEQQSGAICDMIEPGQGALEVLELGPGDGLKSRLFLKSLYDRKPGLEYVPVDISAHALQYLRCKLQDELPGLQVNEKAGDFFHVMKQFAGGNGISRVILFLGSNIGNFYPEEKKNFLTLLSAMTNKGDKVLMGFDLKKSPTVIQNAYDDPAGNTRAFNLNHLLRINRELDGDFDPEAFEHCASYDPVSGAMKSFLVSKKEQKVHLARVDTTIVFHKWEPVYMELSRKFSPADIKKIAKDYGFNVLHHFTDQRNYFTVSLWVKD